MAQLLRRVQHHHAAFAADVFQPHCCPLVQRMSLLPQNRRVRAENGQLAAGFFFDGLGQILQRRLHIGNTVASQIAFSTGLNNQQDRACRQVG